MKLTLFMILITGVLLLCGVSSYGQGCCSASGRAAQVGVFDQSQNPPGQVTVSVFYENVRARRPLLGDQEVDDPLSRRSKFRSLVYTVSVGLPWGFTAHGVISNIKRERSFITRIGRKDSTISLIGSGFSDPVLSVIKSITPYYGWHNWYVSVGSGLRIPLGTDEQREEGVLLPADVQPATGSWDMMFLASVSKSLRPFLVYNHLTWTVTGINTTSYKFGNSLNADFGLSWSGLWKLEPFVRMDLLYLEPDQKHGRVLPSTGSTRWSLYPGLVLSLPANGLTLSGQVGIPVYETVEGNQLGTNTNVIIGLSVLM